MNWKVPFFNLVLGDDEKNAVMSAIESNWLTSGPKIIEFEKAYADVVSGGRCPRRPTKNNQLVYRAKPLNKIQIRNIQCLKEQSFLQVERVRDYDHTRLSFQNHSCPLGAIQ